MAKRQDRRQTMLTRMPPSNYLERMKASYKHGFTLIEVLISFVLVSIIGASLLSLTIMLREASLPLEKKLRVEEKKLSQAHLTRLYLSSILIDENKLSGKGAAKPFFLTEGTNGTPQFTVYTSLMNGLDHVNALSNEVLARFYISSDGAFSLYITTHPTRRELGREEESIIKLWDKVKSVSWEFSSWPKETAASQSKKNMLQGSPSSIDEPPSGEWTREWKKEWKNNPPSLIRVTIFEENGQSETITSVIPEAIQTVYLERE